MRSWTKPALGSVGRWLVGIAVVGTMTASVSAAAAELELKQRLDAIVTPLGIPDGPGAAVLVLKDGRVLYQNAVGYADVAAKIPNTPATNFRLASVSKQFTATATLCLVDDGKLSLDTLLTEAFPGFPAYAKGITIRHLLTHTSGLLDYEEHVPPTCTTQLKDADVLAILAGQDKTYFPIGTQYKYSNSAYALLALIVEKYSGQRFPDFLCHRIFQPAGMTNTVAHEEGITTVPNRAYGHSPRDGAYLRTDQSRDSAVLGDGGIYSSLEDLARWDAALYEGKILKPETQRLAFTSNTLPDGKDIEYGFGWRIRAYRGKPTIGHAGDSIGFRTFIERYPADRFTVVLLSNRADVDPQKIVRQIVDACLFDAR